MNIYLIENVLRQAPNRWVGTSDFDTIELNEMMRGYASRAKEYLIGKSLQATLHEKQDAETGRVDLITLTNQGIDIQLAYYAPTKSKAHKRATVQVRITGHEETKALAKELLAALGEKKK